MTIRRKTLLTVAVTIAGLMAVVYLTTSTVFLGGFARVEENDTRQHVARAIEAVADSVAKIDFTTRDWAGWDDTYKYIYDGNKAYEDANLTAQALGVNGLQMNLILYITPSGEMRFGTGLDLKEEKKVPIPAGVSDHIFRGSLLLDHRHEQSSVGGILMLPAGPMLVASRPILTNEKRGPIRGVLIFGRYLDDAAVAELARITHLALHLHRFDDAQLPEDFQSARAPLSRQGAVLVRPLSRETVAGYTVLKDIYGQTAMILRVDVPRSIYEQGRVTTYYFLLDILGVGIGLGAVTLLLLDKLWLSRLARQASERRFQELFENANDVVFTADLNWCLTSMNRAAERLTGYTREEALHQSVGKILPPEHLARANEMLTGLSGANGTYELEILARDGRRVPVEASIHHTYADGKPVGIQGIVRDITERKQAEVALRESEERYALAAQGANDGLWDWDLRTDRIYFSPRWKAMLGYSDDEIGTVPQEWLSRVHDDDVAHLRSELAAHGDGTTASLECEYRIRHRDGSLRWMLCRGLAVRDEQGRAYRVAGSQTDITERKRVEEQLLHDAFHDGLSGLPNRALFADRLGQAIRRADRHMDYRFAVVSLDIDRFKLVNDSLGHPAGDQLIKAIARRLELSLRATDTVARLGGDEFAILLADLAEPDDAVRVVERMQEGLAAPYNLNGHELFISASIGIVQSAREYARPEDYLGRADVAMYRAKVMGKARYVLFTPEMQSTTVALWQLETGLRQAIEQEEFRIHYQPIISLETGQMVGFEALLRWQHPQRGMVSPGEFIPVAEETGLIAPIGRWVLREAGRQAREWAARFPSTDCFITVNLSGRQLGQPDFSQEIEEMLQQTGVDPGELKLEITESVIMENVEAASAVLTRLNSLNLRISVDDFGTGYSSLAALRRFPVSTIKIDRSFVSGMTTGSENEEIVRAIVMLAHNLGMDVVAEGIETPEQLAKLKALGCEYGQGFLFSRPVDAQAASELLARGANWEYSMYTAAVQAG